jgi:hypothetical protein
LKTLAGKQEKFCSGEGFDLFVYARTSIRIPSVNMPESAHLWGYATVDAGVVSFCIGDHIVHALN